MPIPVDNAQMPEDSSDFETPPMRTHEQMEKLQSNNLSPQESSNSDDTNSG